MKPINFCQSYAIYSNSATLLRLYAIKDTCKGCQYHAIVRYGHALLAGTLHTAEHVATVKHACAAVYDEVVWRKVGGVVRTTHDVYL